MVILVVMSLVIIVGVLSVELDFEWFEWDLVWDLGVWGNLLMLFFCGGVLGVWSELLWEWDGFLDCWSLKVFLGWVMVNFKLFKWLFFMCLMKLSLFWILVRGFGYIVIFLLEIVKLGILWVWCLRNVGISVIKILLGIKWMMILMGIERKLRIMVIFYMVGVWELFLIEKVVLLIKMINIWLLIIMVLMLMKN